MSRAHDLRKLRIVEILSCFERVAGSPAGDTPSERAHLRAGFLEAVCGIDEAWIRTWSRARLRGLLTDFLARCPARDLDELVTLAQGQAVWVELFEHQTEFERTTGKGCYSDEFTAWRAARMAA